MTTNEYLKAILEQEALDENGPELTSLREERLKVEKILKNAFSDSDPSIRYGGSKAKKTMIKSNYDLDVTVYFKSDDNSSGNTLEEIFNNVKEALSKDYFPVAKNAAIQLQTLNGNLSVYTHIDIVPGRFVSEDSEDDDVYIYQNTGEKNRLKTNLTKHIKHISESRLRPEIKLAKIWKVKNNIQIKTFVLELLVIKILKDQVGKSLEENMLFFWNKVKDDIENITIIDPANPGNDLSNIFNESKAPLSIAASNALSLAENHSWDSIFGFAEEKEDSNKSFQSNGLATAYNNSTPPTVISNPSKPWGLSDYYVDL